MIDAADTEPSGPPSGAGRLFGVIKRDGESWRDAAGRQGRENGLESEVLAAFDAFVSCGEPAEHAAIAAVHEWDCAELVVGQA